MVNAITSLSNRPLIYIFYAGLILISLSILYIIYVAAEWAFFDVGVPGWTTTVISIFLLSGIIILFQGIIGIYVAKIFVETKRRPYTIIRAIYQKDTPEISQEIIFEDNAELISPPYSEKQVLLTGRSKR